MELSFDNILYEHLATLWQVVRLSAPDTSYTAGGKSMEITHFYV